MKSERLPAATSEAAQLTSIVVRAGHVISADRADQLAAPGREPLRANRAIPGSILVRRGGNIFRLPCDRIRFLATGRRLHRYRCIGLRLSPSIFRVNRSCPFFRGTFHGPKVIAQPFAREKRVTGVGGLRLRPASGIHTRASSGVGRRTFRSLSTSTRWRCRRLPRRRCGCRRRKEWPNRHLCRDPGIPGAHAREDRC